jgi:hypothetical protein
MNLGILRGIVSQAILEMENGDRVRPSWVAQRAMQIADPEQISIPSVAYAANLEFRQLAREELRGRHEPSAPEDLERQGSLLPGLQAMYPRRRSSDEEDPEYIRRELMTEEDKDWNLRRLRATSATLAERANALEAWWAEFRGPAAAAGGA